MPPKAYIDVLIIGAGPAGLMCAHALAVAGVHVKIIDKRALHVDVGQADGIAPRTIEVLQSYGLAKRLIQEGRHIHMSAFYKPGQSGGIECTERTPIVKDPSARYPYLITLNQAAIEAIFIDSLKDHGLEIERPKQPSALEISISQDVDELSSSSYPVKVTVEHLDALDDESKTEIIHAKYVIGADGAHSWVRKTLGIEMEGEQTEYIWGVVDAVLETNFPDIHNAAVIQSEKGSCLNIPREGDKNRLYIQLSDTDAIDPLTGRVDKNRIGPKKLLSVAKNVLLPYELADPKEIEWWTIYIVGQRVAASYSVQNRVFITGDACHTHSPKAGQGMNAAINDGHNLAWKLVQVLRGWSSSSLLKTYEDERRKFAQDLINMDKEISTLFSERMGAENADESSPELLRAFRAHHSFTMGFSIQYPPSVIVDPIYQKCADNLVIGQKMPPQIFVRAADIHPIDIQDLLPADVRFKILFFVGNLAPNRIAELNSLAVELSKPSSFLRKYSTADGQVSIVFDVVTIVAGKKGDMNFSTIPTLLRPHWTKVLLDDTDTTEKFGGGAYERFGIDPRQITLVVIRPDGYVGAIAPSNALADLDHYFGSFLIPRGLGNSVSIRGNNNGRECGHQIGGYYVM